MNSVKWRLSDSRFRNGVLWNLLWTRQSESVNASVLVRQRATFSVPPHNPHRSPSSSCSTSSPRRPAFSKAVGLFWFYWLVCFRFAVHTVKWKHVLQPVKWLWSLFYFTVLPVPCLVPPLYPVFSVSRVSMTSTYAGSTPFACRLCWSCKHRIFLLPYCTTWWKKLCGKRDSGGYL